MRRKRFSVKSGEWIEYFSIPGGGIDEGESEKAAVIRELNEEMGIRIRVLEKVAHRKGEKFEHHVFLAEMIDPNERPRLMPDSEEARDWHTSFNQFIPQWVSVRQLTKENLRYYSDYLDLIQRLSRGEHPGEVLQIDAR